MNPIRGIPLRGFLIMLMLWLGAVPPRGVADETAQRRAEQIQRALRAGNTALIEDELDRARRFFEAVLRAEPQNREARFAMSTLHIKAGDYPSAIDLLEELAEEFPRDYAVLNNLAWLYATAEETRFRDGDRAVALAQEALLSAPNDYHVWSTLARGHFVAGNYDRSLRAARQALQLSQRQGADVQRVQEYREQVNRSQRAARALSITD